MLRQAPDLSISAWELGNTIKVIKRELRKAPIWQFREEYIDRGILDPYYLFKIRIPEDEKGDDTGSQQLYQGKKPGFSYVNRTRDFSRDTKHYWHDIDIKGLYKRLDHFKDMYDKNLLQPPGSKGDLYRPNNQHEIFPKKRFIYEILSPFKRLTGIGPNMYAVGPGAVCGTVYDQEGKPLDGVTVELVKGDETLSRETRDGGLFWFSRVAEGIYRVRVKNRACIMQIIRRDEFGNIKGWLTDQDGYPVEYADINFRAPDGEVFSATSDDTGKFTTGPLPAFPVTDSPLSQYPYIMQIPNFLFSITKSVVVKDAIIGGVLRDNNGVAIANENVLLKHNGVQVAESKTDGRGNFRFFELAGSKYEIEVPGQKIYLSQSSAGKVEGKEAAGIVNETKIELVAEGKVVAAERLNIGREFSFEHVAPGRYTVRSN